MFADQLERLFLIMIGQPTVAGDVGKHDGGQLAFGGGVVFFILRCLGGLGAGLAKIDDARIILLRGGDGFLRGLSSLFNLRLRGFEFALEIFQFLEALAEFILFFGQLHFLFGQRCRTVNAAQLPFLPHLFGPIFELKIGDIQQTHCVDRQQNHCGTSRAYVLEDSFVKQHADVAAAIHGVELASQSTEEVGVQAQACRAGQNHGDRPRPTFAQSVEFVDQETEGKYQCERRQQIGGHAQGQETTLRQPCANQAHEIVTGIIDLRAIERQVTLVVRE